jgi:hypothetical protein
MARRSQGRMAEISTIEFNAFLYLPWVKEPKGDFSYLLVKFYEC